MAVVRLGRRVGPFTTSTYMPETPTGFGWGLPVNNATISLVSTAPTPVEPPPPPPPADNLNPYPAPSSPLPAIRSVNSLMTAWNNVKGASDTYMASRGPNDASDIYECGYHWEGFACAFEATHDPNTLDIALKHIKRFVNGAKAVAGGYRGWTNQNSSYAGVGGEYPLLESYGWRFVCRILWLMDKIGVSGSYQTDYNDILAFTEKNIWDKWHDRGVNSNMYRQNTHMASHWAGIAMHLAPLTGATRRSQMLTVAKNIMFAGLPNYSGASIKSQMRNHRNNANAYFFNYNWGSFAYPGSDVNHGEATVTQCVNAYDMGLVMQSLGSTGWRNAWGDEEMDKLRTMFGAIIWPSGASQVSANIDGTGNGTWGTRGFAKLGRFHVALQQRLEDAPMMSNNAWHVGEVMANARILRGGRS